MLKYILDQGITRRVAGSGYTAGPGIELSNRFSPIELLERYIVTE